MKVNRIKLLEALKAVQPGLANEKEIVEQSKCFVFSDKRVYTYNDEVAVSHPIDIKLEGAVPAKEFYNLVSKIKKEDLDITITDNELLFNGKSKAGLRLESEITLPINELGIPEKWTKLPTDFNNGVKLCLFSASKDEGLLVLTCIHVVGDLIESCDNYRVTQFNMGKGASKAFPNELLIPASSAKDIVNNVPIEYALNEGWVHFRNEKDVTFSCRYFDGEYPNFDPFLECKGETIEFPKILPEMLDRANVLSDGERVTIIFDKDELIVSTENENGWFEESTEIKYKGSPLEFDIQPEFMKSILKHEGTIMVDERVLLFENDDFLHSVQLLTPKGKNDVCSQK